MKYAILSTRRRCSPTVNSYLVFIPLSKLKQLKMHQMSSTSIRCCPASSPRHMQGTACSTAWLRHLPLKGVKNIFCTFSCTCRKGHGVLRFHELPMVIQEVLWPGFMRKFPLTLLILPGAQVLDDQRFLWRKPAFIILLPDALVAEIWLYTQGKIISLINNPSFNWLSSLLWFFHHAHITSTNNQIVFIEITWFVVTLQEHLKSSYKETNRKRDISFGLGNRCAISCVSFMVQYWTLRGIVLAILWTLGIPAWHKKRAQQGANYTFQ